MGIQEVLTGVRVGVWRLESHRGVMTLDATAAALLDLPAEEVTLPLSAVRARTHVEDYLAAGREITLSAAEDRPREVRVRIMAPDGSVRRVLRLRFHAVSEADVTGLSIEDLAAAGPPSGPENWEWSRAREAFLLDSARALSSAETTADLMSTLISLAMPGFAPDGVALYAREGDRVTLSAYAEQPHGQPRDLSALYHVFPVPLDSRFPACEALRTGQAVYVATPDEFRRTYPDYWPQIEPLSRESWAYLPLTLAGRVTAAWLAAFDYHVDFTLEERSMLTVLARQVAQALARTTLHDTERELSADLQHTMRPAPSPTVPGMEIAVRYVPTSGGLQVGGDWYDVIPLPDGSFAIVIGDVQGHDVRAAAVMAQLRIALRAYASEGHHPDAALIRASRFLAALTAEDAEPDDEPRFATCLYAQLDPNTGTLDVARAGHLDPAMILQDGSVVTRPTVGGLPLGLVQSSAYPTTRLVLQPGETLMLCTDGLLEAGERDLDAGWERLRRALTGLGALDVDGLADAMIETARPRRAGTGGAPASGDADRDDMAVVLLRRPVPERARREGPVRRVVLTVGQSEPARVAEARGQLRALLRDWADRERVDGAVLTLSEMLANVLVHTDGDALLVAEAAGRPGRRLLRVEVNDTSDVMPRVREPGEMASSGRGLLLMEELTDEWGVAPRGEGKTIWFEMREAPAGRDAVADPAGTSPSPATSGQA